MDIDRLVAPSGILAFALFALACLDGFPRWRLFKYHAATGYLCCAVVLAHSVFAIMCHMIDPLGVLASIFMLASAISGLRHARLKIHIGLVVMTFSLTCAHVAFVLTH